MSRDPRDTCKSKIKRCAASDKPGKPNEKLQKIKQVGSSYSVLFACVCDLCARVCVYLICARMCICVICAPVV